MTVRAVGFIKESEMVVKAKESTIELVIIVVKGYLRCICSVSVVTSKVSTVKAVKAVRDF